jgi:hypothetical protein
MRATTVLSNQSGGSISELMVELVGGLSNHEIQERLRRLSEKRDLLSAKGAAPRPLSSLGPQAPKRIGPEAIMRVLSESVEPMRMKDIHTEVA